MQQLSGKELSDEALCASIALYNENRRAIEELLQARSRTPWKYPTPELYQVVRAGAVLPPENHTDMLRRYLELAAAEEERVEMDLSRVVVRGGFCEQPPVSLLKTLERAGCWVVDDDLLLGLRWFTEEIAVDGDPLRSLSRAYLEQSPATASRYEPEKIKGKALVEAVERHQAEGVIFAAPSFCDPALLDQPMLADALDRAGIPYTQFKYSEDMGQFAVIREQTGTFADSIRLWTGEMS
jgi:benzoyl-CoA reductase subunit C